MDLLTLKHNYEESSSIAFSFLPFWLNNKLLRQFTIIKINNRIKKPRISLIIRVWLRISRNCIFINLFSLYFKS